MIGYQDIFPVCSFDGTHSSQAPKKIKCVNRRRFNIQYGRDTNIPKGSKQERSERIAVQIDSKRIVLTIVEGKVYAMNAVCSHKGAPLEEGTLMGYDLKCPWHFALFNVRNGKVSGRTVWATDLESYQVQVEQTTGDILINVSSRAGSADSAKERSAT